jgi:hypothetical protein
LIMRCVIYKTAVVSISFFLIVAISLAQQPLLEDYKVYSDLIRTEIVSRTKSVMIIKKLEKETSSEFFVDAITSGKKQDLTGYTMLIKKPDDTKVETVDSIIIKLVPQYYRSQQSGLYLSNKFNLNIRVNLINQSPIIGRNIQEKWDEFYENNPGSGGIFSFSKIYYSDDRSTAVFYYSLRRNGLNGRGVIAIMKNINGEWKWQYKIFLWQA